ncbi:MULTISPECIES: toll/interleukin-1 receptor domain-containing protein [unclassified Frankia]|uniref:toll/interleukin-1 receptor domain-containing protein n=1 Tax=unclassified Frankia TaxID=2632575 RepID=UPI0020258355
MSLTFISYASEDRAAADLLRSRLVAAGFAGVFLDSDGIPPAARWEKHLWRELRRADAVVFLGSRRSADSQWCHIELVYAWDRGIPVFPVRLEPGLQLSLLTDTQWIDASAGGGWHHTPFMAGAGAVQAWDLALRRRILWWWREELNTAPPVRGRRVGEQRVPTREPTRCSRSSLARGRRRRPE